MTELDQPVLYAERGSSWWPVLWALGFVLAGLGLEALTGRAHVFAWLMFGGVLLVIGVVWVRARQRFLRIRLTPSELVQGHERLEVRRIVAVSEVGTPAGARVLGGSLAVPRKYAGIPLRLEDGTVVLAWARDGESLQAALRELVET